MRGVPVYIFCTRGASIEEPVALPEARCALGVDSLAEGCLTAKPSNERETVRMDFGNPETLP